VGRRREAPAKRADRHVAFPLPKIETAADAANACAEIAAGAAD
jgi:hypothetical protein